LITITIVKHPQLTTKDGVVHIDLVKRLYLGLRFEGIGKLKYHQFKKCNRFWR